MQLAVAEPPSARAVYAQRSTNTLQRVFRDHFRRFAAEYDQRYAKELGNFRIERISRVAHLCPSCSQKRALLFAEYLDEQLLLALSHRQFVFTLPKALRVFVRYDQRLFGQISRLIFSLIAQFHPTASGRPIAGAAVLAFQPFGEALRHNPHFHALILAGGDHRARQALPQYAARAPLSLQKLTYDALGGKVLYHTACNPYLKQNTTLWLALDFIAALTQFIPPWGVRTIH